MRSVIINKPGDWAVGERPEPVPAAREVIVEVELCGVCGTDLHTLNGGNTWAKYPLTPGHEFVGTVKETGEGVIDLCVGDRVAVDPSRSCGRCQHCLGGHANVCERKGGYGSRYPGGFAERTAVLETSCVVLPDLISWRAAVLAEPVACVLNGLRRIGPVLGRRTLIVGGGPIGLIMAYVLRRSGAEVTVSEPVAERREAAEGLGARAIAPDRIESEKWDVVVEATGVPAVVRDSFRLIGRAGTLLLMGVPPVDSRIELEPHRINQQELTILGSSSVNQTFGAAVEFLATSGEDLESIVSAVIPLDDWGQALARFADRTSLKVAVSPWVR